MKYIILFLSLFSLGLTNQPHKTGTFEAYNSFDSELPKIEQQIEAHKQKAMEELRLLCHRIDRQEALDIADRQRNIAEFLLVGFLQIISLGIYEPAPLADYEYTLPARGGTKGLFEIHEITYSSDVQTPSEYLDCRDAHLVKWQEYRREQ